MWKTIETCVAESYSQLEMMSANSWRRSLMGSRKGGDRKKTENVKDKKTKNMRAKKKIKSTMHTAEQSSLMGEEGVLLFLTSSTSSSSFSFAMGVDCGILYCKKVLSIKKHSLNCRGVPHYNVISKKIDCVFEFWERHRRGNKRAKVSYLLKMMWTGTTLLSPCQII